MPDWWFEATLPTVVFGTLFVLWVVLPPSEGEIDFGSKVREFLKKRCFGWLRS